MAFWKRRQRTPPPPPPLTPGEQRRRDEVRMWQQLLDDSWIDGDPDPIYDYWLIDSVEPSTWAIETSGKLIPIKTFTATFMDDERHPEAIYEVAAVEVEAAIEPTEKRKRVAHTVGEVVSVAGRGVVIAGRCWNTTMRSSTPLPEHERTAPVSELVDELRRRGLSVSEC